MEDILISYNNGGGSKNNYYKTPINIRAYGIFCSLIK